MEATESLRLVKANCENNMHLPFRHLVMRGWLHSKICNIMSGLFIYYTTYKHSNKSGTVVKYHLFKTKLLKNLVCGVVFFSNIHPKLKLKEKL